MTDEALHLSSLISDPFPSESGGTGRRTRLRILRLTAWGFDSPLSHQRRLRARFAGEVAQGVDSCGQSRAGVAQLVEHNLAKVVVVGSSPITRSSIASRGKALGGGAGFCSVMAWWE